MNFQVLDKIAEYVSTHSRSKFFKSFRSGNVIVGPFKSVILLIQKCFINKRNCSYIEDCIHNHCTICRENAAIQEHSKKEHVLTIESRFSTQIWLEELGLP